MIVTASTVKDRLSNVQRFVEGNLAGGADHLIIFLDDHDADVESWLAECPDVTAVVSDDSYWNGDRPALLNRRQVVNANLAKAAVARWGGVQWIFHVDGDEIVQIDRAALGKIGRAKPAVNLRPLEAVSIMAAHGDPEDYKRLLTPGELHLLHALGLLSEPTNSRYFRSHIAGKVGVRPGSETWLGIHKATNAAGERVQLVRRPELRMLHLESISGEDFVRKWTNMVSSGPSMHFGEHRQGLAAALKTLISIEIPEQVRNDYLMNVYERHMAEPVEDLARLGFLEHIDLRAPLHEREPTSSQRREELRVLLAQLAADDKSSYVLPTSPDVPDPSGPGERETASPRQFLRGLRSQDT